ncbi:MAG: M50 family metallopeptidase, partial [Clostridium sp.]
GLLSGYKFISFRVGSITIVKDEGKYKIKKYKIKGTGGQCLMMPTVSDYKDNPYKLYNLGGIIINTIVVIVSGILYKSNNYSDFINTVSICLVTTGVICVLSNGIPLKIGGIANDGYNYIAIGKNELIKRCFYTQLKVNGLIYLGVRVKDMDFSLFELDGDYDINNPIITGMKLMEANYYHDKKEFLKAKECLENTLNITTNILKIYEYEINCELLFYEIIGDKDENKIQKLYTKELKQYIKATDCYISRKRLMYAYYKLVENDIDKTNKLLVEIDKVKKTYPAKSELESELEIIDYISKLEL